MKGLLIPRTAAPCCNAAGLAVLLKVLASEFICGVGAIDVRCPKSKPCPPFTLGVETSDSSRRTMPFSFRLLSRDTSSDSRCFLLRQSIDAAARKPNRRIKPTINPPIPPPLIPELLVFDLSLFRALERTLDTE